MERIIPVEDKLKIQKYSLRFGIDFSMSSYAYVALGDSDEIGMCTFEINHDACVITALRVVNEYLNTMLPYLLIRSVIHAAYECDIKKVIIKTQDVSDMLAAQSGFMKTNDDEYVCRIYNPKRYIYR